MRQKIFYAYWVCGKNYSTPTQYAVKEACKFSKLFHAHWVCGKNYSTPTEYAAKIMPRPLSMRQKLFHAHWVCGKNYATPTEYAAKIIPRLLSMRQKLFHAYWVFLAHIALKLLKRLQIRAQATLDSGIGSLESIPGLLKRLQIRLRLHWLAELVPWNRFLGWAWARNI